MSGSADDMPPWAKALEQTLSARLAGLEQSLTDQLGRAHTHLWDEITRLRTDVMDRIDRLQDSVEALRADVTVNFGNTDRVELIAEGSSEETRALAKIVRTMQRQIHTLQSEVRALRGES